MENHCTTSLRICQEGHANALALNKNADQIAVAGRSLLKVFAINDGFTEVCNMRGGKNQNLSYSSNDVAWSTLDSNILATAATNGVVSVWDLSRFGRQKQLLVFNEHERTAHTVTFHKSESNILISGSQDGTIKYFDIRSDKSVYTYFSNSESVRDVKFSPHTNNVFSAVSENGTVQLWDLRKWDKCILQFTAHSGPIYSCDWHPNKNWLATGSRDKQIKIWNMDGKASLEHTIHTIAVVGRVKWRPERLYHIASCALVVDYSIHIWDIRRPYIPYASFNEHSNITTDIAWKGDDSHCLLSTSKDSTIYKHAFKDATRPALKANAQGAGLGCRDDIYFANKKKVLVPVTAAQVLKSNTLTTAKHKSPTVVEQFHIAMSNTCQFRMQPSYTGFVDEITTVQRKEHECFIGCAREFILNCQKLADTCEHNANVSKKYSKHNATTLWNFIKILYGTSNFNSRKIEHRNSSSKQKNSQVLRRSITQVTNALALDEMQWEDSHDHDVGNLPISSGIDEKNQNTDGLNGVLRFNTGTGKSNCSVIISESQVLTEISFDNFDLLRNGFIYIGPADITKALSFPDTTLHHDVQAARSQIVAINAENKEKVPTLIVPSIVKISNIPNVPLWEPHKFIADALLLQSDMGDIQTVLTILIIMMQIDAKKLLPISEELIEHWFHSYIDQLHRYQLWNEACTIINMSWLRSVRALTQQSTSVHINCGDCGRLLSGKVGWYCQKCKSAKSSKCCVCGLVVRGLYAWCQGCSHGGHLEHLREYFQTRSKCPKCGHLCEYN